MINFDKLILWLTNKKRNLWQWHDLGIFVGFILTSTEGSIFSLYTTIQNTIYSTSKIKIMYTIVWL